MRDLRNVDASGKGKSKEFGFVCFTSHENALHALRSLNNNPDIFTPAKVRFKCNVVLNVCTKTKFV